MVDIKKYWDTPSSILFKVLYRNQTAILKIFKSESDETWFPIALKAYGSSGAVKVLKYTDSAILMQELKPANVVVEVTKSGNDKEATTIFCDVTRKLHKRKCGSMFLPPILDLAKGFYKYAGLGVSIIPNYLLNKAQKIFLNLESTQKQIVVSHGDLNHFNIM